MKLSQLLTPQHVHVGEASSKKQVIEQLSQDLAADALDPSFNDIYSALMNREKLGSTAIGDGFALPHARVSSLDQVRLSVLRLDQGVDFQAPDQQPVCFFLALLVPGDAQDHHLELLSQLADLFQREALQKALMHASTAHELYQAALKYFDQAEIPDEVLESK